MASAQTSTSGNDRRSNHSASESTTALDNLALSLHQLSFGVHSNTTPLSTMAMAHAFLVHSSRFTFSSSSAQRPTSSSAAATTTTAAAATCTTFSNMSKSLPVVPAKHYPCSHDAIPEYAFEEADKPSAFDRGDDRVADAGRLQQYLLRSDETGDCRGWSGLDTGRLSYEEGGNCHKSFYQYNQHQYNHQLQFHTEDQSCRSSVIC
ncbi:hypothetical protein EC991_003309 [Linnemannia zychae]|nr:hypothetical protein EC991_003309 [Linnemannia zychae]